jgi:hypothetical protein
VTHATRHIRAMETGYTLPHLFECDDGYQYVVKFMSNPQGIRGLAKELIAYRLGKMLDLPVVQGNVIYITKELIDRYPILRKNHVKPGPHFGSLYIENAQYPSRKAIRQCINVSKAAGMIVFDNWIQNTDRRSGNVLVTKSSQPKFRMIDHQGIFGGSSWREENLLRYRHRVKPYWTSLYSLFVEFIDHKNNPFLEEIERLEACSRSNISKAMLDIPEEWGIEEEEFEMLIDYLDRRRRLLREAILQLKPYFPNWMENSIPW